jgi:hypothetical protein
MKADQKKQCDYILDRLRKGQERAEILQQFSKVFKKDTTRTFDNRLKIARAQFDSESERIKQEAEKGIEKDIEALKSKIMTPVERLVTLSEIARGEKEIETVFFDKGVPKKIKSKPNFNDIKGAIAELNKMGGDYAPQKIDVKTGEPVRVFVLNKAGGRK